MVHHTPHIRAAQVTQHFRGCSLTRRSHLYSIFKKFSIFEAARLPVGSVYEAVLPVGGTVIPDRLNLSRDRAVLQHCQTHQENNH